MGYGECLSNHPVKNTPVHLSLPVTHTFTADLCCSLYPTPLQSPPHWPLLQSPPHWPYCNLHPTDPTAITTPLTPLQSPPHWPHCRLHPQPLLYYNLHSLRTEPRWPHWTSSQSCLFSSWHLWFQIYPFLVVFPFLFHSTPERVCPGLKVRG